MAGRHASPTPTDGVPYAAAIAARDTGAAHGVTPSAAAAIGRAVADIVGPAERERAAVIAGRAQHHETPQDIAARIRGEA